MNTKIIALLILVMFLATPVLAAITVTINTPSSGQTYNNLPANVGPVDINFSVADNNATVDDHNITVTIYNSKTLTTMQTLVNDVNVRNLGSSMTCEPVTAISLLDAYTCNVHWDMPGVESMPAGTYLVDVNVTSVYSSSTGGSDTHVDTNASTGITVNNKLANSATIQALLLVISTIVFAGLIIVGVVSITMMGTDPAKTATALVAAGIMVGILMMVLGMVAQTI